MRFLNVDAEKIDRVLERVIGLIQDPGPISERGSRVAAEDQGNRFVQCFG